MTLKTDAKSGSEKIKNRNFLFLLAFTIFALVVVGCGGGGGGDTLSPEPPPPPTTTNTPPTATIYK